MNYNDQQQQQQQQQHQQFMMQQQYGQFDHSNQMQGMHSNMPMGAPQQQRMSMDHHQRPNFPQQIQRVPSQGTFQMNTGQPTFQQGNPNTQSYLIRAPGQQSQQPMQQQMPNNMVMKQNPMSQGNMMQQRMNASNNNIQQQAPRLMHPNYASSSQLNQTTNASNISVSQIDIKALIAQMPPSLRQQFDESDNAKRNMILRDFSKRFQLHPHGQQLQQQQMQYNQFDQPNQMQNSGMLPNMSMQTSQQRMSMDQQRPNFPPQMQHVSSQGNFTLSQGQPHFQQASGAQQYLIRAPQQQQQPQPVQNIVLKHSPMPSQSVSGPTSMSQRTGGPPSAGNIQQPRSMHSNYSNSPQINQPASAQNVVAAPTPRPAPTPAPVINTDDPEYKKLLAELKSYHKEAKILLERVRVDGHDALEKSLLRVIEVMDGKRDVDIKLLTRLLGNLKSTIRCHNPMRGVIDLANRITVVPHLADCPILPDGWDQLEQFKIRIPASVLRHVDKVKEDDRMSRKRMHTMEPESMDFTKDDDELFCKGPNTQQKSAQVGLSKEITDELVGYNFSIDPYGFPISEHVLYTQILIEFKPKSLEKFKYNVPPLRINIPSVNYPENPIQFVHYHEDEWNPLQLRIMDALKKSITDESIMHSISKLVSQWKKIVIQNIIPPADTETRRLLS